jgi:hypothetical protein
MDSVREVLVAVDADWERIHEAQQRVLQDVQSRTGFWFPKIAAINTSEARIAEHVLPILAEWVALTSEENIRGAIYSRFHTRYASRYVPLMLRWARDEPHKLGRNSLVQAIAAAVRPEDAIPTWHEIKAGTLSGFDTMLMAKLSTFPCVAREVKDHLVGILESGKARLSDLQYIGKVEDPRISDWFNRQADSLDPRVRLIARRVVAKGKKLPRGCEYAGSGPDLRRQLFSAEVDVSEVGGLFDEMARRFQIQIPKGLPQSAVWTRAEVDRWIRVDLKSTTAPSPTLWIRLEDVDAVHVVLAIDDSVDSDS